MLQAYSNGVDVAILSAVPFNSVALEKGCTATLSGTTTIQLNKRGVYMVSVDGVASAETTLQLERDGVELPQAQSTGTTLGFETLVPVDKDNSNCCCSSPVNLQVVSSAAVTMEHCNICVTKLC